MYSLLSFDNLKSLAVSKYKWGEELDTKISKTQWQATLKNIHQSVYDIVVTDINDIKVVTMVKNKGG